MRHSKYSYQIFTNLTRLYTFNHRAITEHQATEITKKKKYIGLIDVNNRLGHSFDSLSMRNIDK